MHALVLKLCHIVLVLVFVLDLYLIMFKTLLFHYENNECEEQPRKRETPFGISVFR